MTASARRLFGGAMALATALAGLPAAAEGADPWHPTLNFYGVTGLVDMPTGQSQPDGQFSTTFSTFAGMTRATLSFQIAPRLSGSFRFSRTKDLNLAGFVDYSDRSFDVQYRVLREGRILPDLVVGLQDFAGTGLAAAEYVVASKHLAPNLVLTGGIGWGRLGSYNPLGAPFGSRPPLNIGRGGSPNVDQYFRGPAALFGGVEWQPTDKLGLKLEYSSDDYAFEEGRGVIKHRSPFSFGVEYQARKHLRLGAYYLYGSELGVTAQISLNPKDRPAGGDLGKATYPVEPRPARSADPDAWSEDWVAQPQAADILRRNTAKMLAETGLVLEAMAISGDRVELWLRNPSYDAEAQAIGRAARVLTRTMPASVETFEIVPVVKGMPTAKVVLRRTDIEALENAPNGAARLFSVAGIADASRRPENLTYDEELYPRLTWSLAPYLKQELFDPDHPYRVDLGMRLATRYELRPGLFFSGSVTKSVTNAFSKGQLRPNNSVLPHVRTDEQLYTRQGDPGLETLTMAWYARPGQDLYGRVTAGYLERMYGGVSAELLWKPQHSRLALGVEVNYARKRDYDGGLGFRDYDIVTGHASAYYDLSQGYRVQLDAGRYLAGDWGATLAFDRVFANGWTVGAFATLTDVSAKEFGEGSFDKGIRVTIPISWMMGSSSRSTASTTIRPIQRDGGARLSVDGRLYETIDDYHRWGIERQWGKVWR
ncbi:YjbH domain-containing protein [Actibacterium sp. MT2.3-13A]|uniref:YjbH domain-containing protein n=1 Tax=Actibacterium sp. MT2.3-13A TaxID=2828332 RepID=UPI001BA99A4D|nr:YjbH domain-containing protein [Actibacterium sp. MT2.3-13A]